MSEVGVVVDEASVRELAKRWWVPLLIGLASVIIGVIVIIKPVTGVFAVAVLIAVGFVLSGLTDLASAPRWAQHKWIPIVWGLLSLAVGVIAVVWPEITLWALAVLIGIGLILRGLVRAVGSVLAPRPYLWGLLAIVGVVELVAGVLAIAWPTITLVILAILIGIDLVLVGAAEIAFAVQLKKLEA